MKHLIYVLALFLLISSCKKEEETEEIKSITIKGPVVPSVITVTILPYSDFVKAIFGNDVKINVLVPPGSSPEHFELTPKQLSLLEKTDAYIRVGADFAFENTLISKTAGVNNKLKIINTDIGIDIIDENPHIWLSPKRVLRILENINSQMQITILYERKYRANYKSYYEKIRKLDSLFTKGFSGVKKKDFVVYHPAWTYLAADYGLVQTSIERHGKTPNAGDLAEIIRFGKEKNIRTIFTEKQSNPKHAERIASEIGAKVGVLDPLPEDYISGMTSVYEELMKELSK